MGKTENLSWVELKYEEGGRIVRYWIDCRYKILQFVGYYNAAVLTFGFSEGILLSDDMHMAGAAISLLSVFVALMGLATEASTTRYNSAYLDTLRGIDKRLEKTDRLRGVFTAGRNAMEGNPLHKVLPVHRAHMIFYIFLVLLWGVLAVYEITRACSGRVQGGVCEIEVLSLSLLAWHP